MDPLPRALFTIGALFLGSLVADALGRRTPLPRVTLMILLGVVIGPSVLGLIPLDAVETWFSPVAHMALAMVGFLLGNSLDAETLRRKGRAILSLSVFEVVAVGVIVSVGLWLLGVPLEVSLILAATATATDPAAVMDVVDEGHASGPATDTLLGVTAIDDAWGLLAFSLLLSCAEWAHGNGGSYSLLHGAWEVGGAILVGGVLGIPTAFLTGRLDPGEPTLTETLGAVFLCSGVALWLDVSFLLATMTLGAVVANLAQHHERPFHAIEDVDWPFMLLFFVLAGASLELAVLGRSGFVLGAYVLFRAASRLLGAVGWAAATRSDRVRACWLGLALLPQAGVAIGMALVAVDRLPEFKDTILPIVIGSTIVFEVCGPVLTRLSLSRLGELHLGQASSGEGSLSRTPSEDEGDQG